MSQYPPNGRHCWACMTPRTRKATYPARIERYERLVEAVESLTPTTLFAAATIRELAEPHTPHLDNQLVKLSLLVLWDMERHGLVWRADVDARGNVLCWARADYWGND